MFHRNILVGRLIIFIENVPLGTICKKIRNVAITYTQLHIQLIFAVKYRVSMIEPAWKELLHKYITGIFQGNNHKTLQVNSMPDHSYSHRATAGTVHFLYYSECENRKFKMD